MATTLTDIARHAGVSLATASRAFGAPERLAEATLQRVRAAATELGYETPSATATEKTLAVILPDAASPVYATLLKGIQSQAWHGRHTIVLFDTEENARREREQIIRARAFDGMLLCSPRLPSEEILELVGSTPHVIVNRIIDGAPSVVMDAERGPLQAVEHLVALGHRHIAYASGPARSWADIRRGEVVAKAADHFGLRMTRLTHQSASIQGGRAAAAPVVASGATAVIAYNDLMALGIEVGFEDLEKSCPDDISIIGHDDLALTATRRKGLTTVRVAIDRCGSLSVETLLQTIDGAQPDSVVTLDSQLIVRGSTAAPRRAR